MDAEKESENTLVDAYGDKHSIVVPELDQTIIEYYNDQSMRDYAKKQFQKLSNFYISYVLRLQAPEINTDFPDELPPELSYPGRNGVRQKDSSKAACKKIVEEAPKFVGEFQASKKRRTTRYQGYYHEKEFSPTEDSSTDAYKKTQAISNQLSAPKLSSESDNLTLGSCTVVSETERRTRSRKLSININKKSSSNSLSSLSISSSSSSSSSCSGDSASEDEIPQLTMKDPKPAIQVIVNTVTTNNSSNLSDANNNSSERAKLENVFAQGKTFAESMSQYCNSKQSKISKPTSKEIPMNVLQSNKSKQCNTSTNKTETMPPPVIEASVFNPRTRHVKRVEATDIKLQNYRDPAQLERAKNIQKNSINEPKKNRLELISVANKLPSPANKLPLPANKLPLPANKLPLPANKLPSPASKLPSPANKLPSPANTNISKKSPVLTPKFRIPKIHPGNRIGGIFAIDNGWDKTQEEIKSLKRSISPSKPTPTDKRRSCNVTKENSYDIEDAHEAFNKMDFISSTLTENVEPNITSKFSRLLSSSSSSSDEDDHSEPVNKHSEISSGEENEPPPAVGNTSELAEIEQEEAQKSNDKELNQQDSGNSKQCIVKDNLDISDKSVENDDDDGDVISLIGDLADLDSLDDFEETVKKTPKISQRPKTQQLVATNAVYTTALDELRLTITKEKLSRSDFEKTTEEICKKIQSPSEPPMQKHLTRYYGNICGGWLMDKCNGSCHRNHLFMEIDELRKKTFDFMSIADADEAYDVMTNYPKLFFNYCTLAAEVFAKFKSFDRLANMVKQCERTPRTYMLYKNIVDALIRHGILRHRAIQFVIDNHNDSDYSRAVILQMITDVGPDIVRFCPYLYEVRYKMTLPVAVFDKLLDACVCYQHPWLPMLCLDELLQRPSHHALNPANIAKFLKLCPEIISVHDQMRLKLPALANKCLVKK